MAMPFNSPFATPGLLVRATEPLRWKGSRTGGLGPSSHLWGAEAQKGHVCEVMGGSANALSRRLVAELEVKSQSLHLLKYTQLVFEASLANSVPFKSYKPMGSFHTVLSADEESRLREISELSSHTLSNRPRI